MIKVISQNKSMKTVGKLLVESMEISKASITDISNSTQIHKIFADRETQKTLYSSLKQVCDLLRINFSLNPVASNEDIAFKHVHFKAGQRIYSMGQAFETLYIVNTGFLKTVVIDELGNEQVLSFPMKSDLLCMDGIHTKRHVSEAIALTDCDLIMLPFKTLLALGRSHDELECAMYGIMSRELMREQSMSVLLGSLSAEDRVKQFLVSLSDRFALLGYSSKNFNLRMTRHEIGSYLGLKLETVSRTLSALQDAGLILVDQKSIELKDIHALRTCRKLISSNMRAKKVQASKENISSNASFLPYHKYAAEISANV